MQKSDRLACRHMAALAAKIAHNSDISLYDTYKQFKATQEYADWKNSQ